MSLRFAYQEFNYVSDNSAALELGQATGSVVARVEHTSISEPAVTLSAQPYFSLDSELRLLLVQLPLDRVHLTMAAEGVDHQFYVDAVKPDLQHICGVPSFGVGAAVECRLRVHGAVGTFYNAKYGLARLEGGFIADINENEEVVSPLAAHEYTRDGA